MANTRFSIDTRQNEPLEGYLVYVSKAEFGADWHSTLHTHYFTELFYITHGNGQFIVEKDTFDVSEDDMIIINPYVGHTEVSSGIPLGYVVLGIEGISFSTASNSTNGYTLLNFSDIRDEFLFYLHSLLIESENKNTGYKTVCQSLLQILVINMTRHIGSNFLIEPTVKTNMECGFLKRYIDANYAQTLTLDSLASITHMNKYYLVHTFSKLTGYSPIAYLNNKRIEESCNLLQTTNLSISQIADAVGFASQSYFAQSFKKYMKETPLEFRKRKKSIL